MADLLFTIGLACGIAAALYVAGWLFLDVRRQAKEAERQAWQEYQKGWLR